MILRILVLTGMAGVAYFVQMATALITQNMYLAVFASSVCAFGMGFAAAKDAVWRD